MDGSACRGKYGNRGESFLVRGHPFSLDCSALRRRPRLSFFKCIPTKRSGQTGLIRADLLIYDKAEILSHLFLLYSDPNSSENVHVSKSRVGRREIYKFRICKLLDVKIHFSRIFSFLA